MKETEIHHSRDSGTGDKRVLYKVYSIIEKPKEQKNYWLDIGIARVNRDESITCKLDALPISGVIQLRRHEPRSQGSDALTPGNTKWQKGGY